MKDGNRVNSRGKRRITDEPAPAAPVESKFDFAHQAADIIQFADLGDFINAPIKVYSSGMVARSAFSIAVHILPEIIFLDEVLAVSDVGFAEKCRHRLFQLRNEGGTIVMVSHSPSDIQAMCTRVLWLNKGELVMDGTTDSVYRNYMKSLL